MGWNISAVRQCVRLILFNIVLVNHMQIMSSANRTSPILKLLQCTLENGGEGSVESE